MRKTLAVILALASLAALAGAAVVWGGLYDISATDQHLPPTYWLLDKAMQRSAARRAARIAVPPLDAPALKTRGLGLYRMHCAQCHGAPGVAPEPFALGLTPVPAPLVQTGREWPPAQIFWVVKHGIKMSGMPAWVFRMTDDDIWAVVAFIRELPLLSPAQYRELTHAAAHRTEEPLAVEPDAERGKTALRQYACVACHRVPGITGPDAHVGPPLAGIASRKFLGGVVTNTPENMLRWIREPQALAPLTAMPALGVTEKDAGDIAAYLATLK